MRENEIVLEMIVLSNRDPNHKLLVQQLESKCPDYHLKCDEDLYDLIARV